MDEDLEKGFLKMDSDSESEYAALESTLEASDAAAEKTHSRCMMSAASVSRLFRAPEFCSLLLLQCPFGFSGDSHTSLA